MSRIVGITSKETDCQRPSLLRNMLGALGSCVNKEVVSLSSGFASLGWCGWKVPNYADDQGVISVMDGSIYNRDELGHAATDAELVSDLYRRCGFEATVKKINGDFAIALYDPQANTLWLARDRFGMKPLYYVVKRGYFAFASQPRSLLALPGISREVNREFVALFASSHYRYFDNNPERSPYADICQLAPATALHFKDGKMTKSVYWSLQDFHDFTESQAELASRYRELLRDAVSRRLQCAQRPTFTLSGGMDSSSVLASAVDVSDSKQTAVSTVYVDKTYDESNEIEAMVATKVECWNPVVVNMPDVFGLVEKMVEAHDEPVATATWLSHYLLCKEAARLGYRSLFGGLGGDELNAGEYEYFFYHFADLCAVSKQEQLTREVEKWISYHDHPIFRKNFGVVEDAFSRLVDLGQPGKCLPDRRRLDRYVKTLNIDYFDLEKFEPVMEHPFTSYLKNRTHQDLSRETIPCCLRAEERQTSVFGLDHYLPFLDYRLVEFMFRIPGTFKICDGVTKVLLREAMCGLLPETTRTRVKKTGWNAPAHVWFSGRGHDNLLDLVHSRSFQERGIYNLQEVYRIIREHNEIVSTGRLVENHMMFLWQLINVETWLQRNRDEDRSSCFESPVRCGNLTP